MAVEPISLVLQRLDRMDEKLGRMDGSINPMRGDIRSVNEDPRAIKSLVAGALATRAQSDARAAGLKLRVERIERRFELREQ